MQAVLSGELENAMLSAAAQYVSPRAEMRSFLSVLPISNTHFSLEVKTL
jgi:hypothetical protein